ncbi:hypothetical protein JGK44_003863 [Shewanella algae]|nr:hypothetical protein [Shewanella algae]
MRFFLLLLISTLFGCASPPKTISDFKSGEYTVRTLCSNFSVEEVYKLLLNKIAQCYQSSGETLVPAGNMLIPIGHSTYVESSVLDDDTRQIATAVEASWNRFYQQLVEIGPSENCSSNVYVYEFTSAWERHTQRIRDWLDGKEVSGCGVW